jgi:hypothetical protein
LGPFSGSSHAAGIEAAASAEELIAFCNSKSVLSRPGCLNSNLNRKWKYELEYAGKPFSAIGKFEEIRKSLAGNLFAFVKVEQYRVACQVTEKNAEALKAIGGSRNVWINGVLESYHLTFNLRSFHHLRLTPYCEIEPAV